MSRSSPCVVASVSGVVMSWLRLDLIDSSAEDRSGFDATGSFTCILRPVGPGMLQFCNFKPEVLQMCRDEGRGDIFSADEKRSSAPAYSYRDRVPAGVGIWSSASRKTAHALR